MSNPNDYTVGWICAISTELVAATVFLDEEHDPPNAVSPRDNNMYTLGKMGKHNIVIAALPDGEYGISAAVSVARDMLHSFPNVRIGLMVGIGGGVPGRHDIRLGDVVVSATGNEHGGIFQYDFGKTIQAQEFQNTMFLNQPPALLRSAVGGLKADYEINGHQFQETINSILIRKSRLQQKYQRPDPDTDRLYLSSAVHSLTSNESCATACGGATLVPRAPRVKDQDNPAIHYGLIASGNQLMKDAMIRDQLASKKDVLCFEMEAAGLMNHFPCLVIRGICDYSDSHKNKTWQGYAAMTAAAYAKDLIGRIPPTRIETENRIADVLSGVKQSVDRLVSVYHDQRNIDILNWLAPFSYSAQQNDYLRRRQQGTGEWLLNSDEFQTWMKNESHMLFCPGMPGAGKTVLTSVVVDHLRSKFEEDSKTGIAYFFFNYKRQDEQAVDVLLANFLRQLIAPQPSLPDAVHELYKQHNTQNKKTRPSTEEFFRILKSVAMTYSRIFMVIDALDECEWSNGTRSRVQSCIFKLRSEIGANFFVTSRFNTEILNAFSSVPLLEIRASDDDVQRYLSGNMVHLPSFVRNDPHLQKEIIDKILRAVQGMFLLAQFQLDSLKGKTTPNEITVALQNLVTGFDAYEQIYNETMKRIVSQYKEQTQLAMSVLSWLTFAKRPMEVAELQHALGVEPRESDLNERNIPDIELMISVCAGLVTIDNDSNIIRLVHYTAQEYFQHMSETWFPEAQAKITITCITYMSYEVFELKTYSIHALMRRTAHYWFYGYASLYWGDHAREDSVLREAVMELLKDAARIKSYCKTFKHIGLRRGTGLFLDLEYQTTGLHLATWFGLIAAINLLLKNNNSLIETTNEPGEAALHVAAKCGHRDIVQLLLDHNAYIEVVDRHGNTPLHIAASKGHKDIVQLLLSNKANLDAVNKNRETVLHVAVHFDKKSVVQLLLDKGANVMAKDDKNFTPLHKSWSTATAQLLLDKGADIEAISETGYTPLHLVAALNGDEELVALLLSKGAKVNAIDGNRKTPLSWAIEGKQLKNYRRLDYSIEHVVQLLLNYGADIEASDENGYTPLHLAIQIHYNVAAALLLSKGANVNATDNNGKTPLHWVITGAGDCAMYHCTHACAKHLVQLLLASGANIEVIDKSGCTALQVATEMKYESIVKLLLVRNARAPDMTVMNLRSLIEESEGEDTELDEIFSQRLKLFD